MSRIVQRRASSQTSRDRLAANFFIAIPVAVVLFVIWRHQKSSTPSVGDSWSTP